MRFMSIMDTTKVRMVLGKQLTPLSEQGVYIKRRLNMLDYQAEALARVRDFAKAKNAEYQALADEFCKPSEVDVSALIDRVLFYPITINFHPDRFSNIVK